ncbi:MAG TPA: hypothetical protein VG963_24150 [Polyangiaceae bacterium]|nr:hypothetical protein [Polyangiaceae bacterium]
MPHPIILFGTCAVTLSLIAALVAILLFRAPAAPVPPERKRPSRSAAPRWRFRHY